MRKVIIITIIAAAITIILLSAVGKSQTQTEQPERTQPIITTAAVTTALEAKEKMTTVYVTTKTTTSITTTAPVNTAITTEIVTTSEKTNTTTAPATIEKETTTTTQPPLKVVTTETTPANGTVKGDKIYVCGFGWIDYEGGGGIGEVNEQMYQNGNKIGYFGGRSDTSKQTHKTKTTQPPDKVITADKTPANGTVKGDMIYIIGFGWVENEGGGGEGTYDHEMKTNGNKIGCFG